MKSNYPRLVGQADKNYQPDRPNVALSAIALTILTASILQLVHLGVVISSDVGPQKTFGIANVMFIPIAPLAILTLVVVSKSSRWPLGSKALLVVFASLGFWSYLTFQVFRTNSNREALINDSGAFGIALLWTVFVCTVLCGGVWTAEAVFRRWSQRHLSRSPILNEPTSMMEVTTPERLVEFGEVTVNA